MIGMPVLQHNFEDSVGYWICMASRAYERAINDELLPRGITHRQAQVLGWLAIDGELSQTDLAERMRVEPPTLVGILDRMEREGWIRRESCATDRRRKMIQVRPKAEPVWSKILDCAARVRERAVEGLTPDEVVQLRKLLGQVQHNLRMNEPSVVAIVSEAPRSN